MQKNFARLSFYNEFQSNNYEFQTIFIFEIFGGRNCKERFLGLQPTFHGYTDLVYNK